MKTDKTKIAKKKALATSVLSSSLILLASQAQAYSEPRSESSSLRGHEKCYGVSKAGKNDCGTAAHDCALLQGRVKALLMFAKRMRKSHFGTEIRI